jgi:hypothetical protein
VTLEEDGRAPWSSPFIGVQLDVGVPDGIGASLVVTPGRFLRVSLGGLSNGVGAGVRLGVTLLAFPSSIFRPLLAVDGGYVFGGQAVWLPQLIDDATLRSAITGVNVGFATAQIGFELGSKHFAFTLRAGLSYVDVGVGSQSISTGGTSTVTANGLAVRGFIPSARLGFIFCFG